MNNATSFISLSVAVDVALIALLGRKAGCGPRRVSIEVFGACGFSGTEIINIK